MILQIDNVLDEAALDAIREISSRDNLWSEGKQTAAGRARDVKNNEQLRGDNSAAKGVIEKIKRSILANAIVRSAAQPAAFCRVMLNRYQTGMSYGAHVDAAYVDGARTDISFTLFLNDPEDYEGGALVIDSAGAEDAIRLAAGAMVLYPSSSVHQVEEVTRGERIAAIGWIKSRVKSDHHRTLLFELETAQADLGNLKAPTDLQDRLANVRNNLLREFGD